MTAGSGVLRYWDVDSGKELAAFGPDTGGNFYSLALSEDGKRVIGGGQDRVVAGAQRPGGELDQVREDDRHLLAAAPAAARLRERLPDLHRAEAELARHARPLGGGLRNAPGDQVGGVVAARRERIVPQLRVARQEASGEPRDRQQPVGLVGPADAAREAPHGLGFPSAV